MSALDIWMKLYVGDYLADTSDLTAAQHGAYLLLLMHQWRRGIVPKDAPTLARITRCTPQQWAKQVGPFVLPFFTEHPEGYVQKRLALVRAEAISTQGQTRAAANAKWGRERSKHNGVADADASSPHMRETLSADADAYADAYASQSQSQSQKEKKETPARELRASPLEPSDAEPNAPPSAPPATGARASRISPDWQPSTADVEFARELGLNPDTTAAEFRDYWLGEGGQRSRKLDWGRAWRANCTRLAEMRRDRREQPQRETASAARRRKLGISSILDFEETDRTIGETPNAAIKRG